jgi:DNA-binding GntR family transcriptional regulator
MAAEPSIMASQRVVDVLAERILTGQLRPGDRIKQDELAAELNMSRIPVRDALRTLETRGLVTLRANAGARVTSLTLRDMGFPYQFCKK